MVRHRLTTWTVAIALLGSSVQISTSCAAEDLWSEYEGRCNKVLAQITASQFAELEADFNAEMKVAVPAGKIAQVCIPLLEAVGEINTIVAHQQTRLPGSNLASFELWVRPANSTNLLRVNLAFDQANKIAGLLLTPTQETVPPAEKTVALSEYDTKTHLTLPFHGEWTVVQGGPMAVQNAHAGNRNQRHAYDFWLADDTGARFRNSGQKNDDYFTFGQPVLAPGDGCVRQVVDGVEDNVPGERNPYFVPGNLVVIDHQNGEYSFLAHFKQGTIEVQVGQQLKQGEQLGLCGNSGNSSEPHIHYHLANAPLMQDGDGLPARFQQITIDGKPATSALPVLGNRVSNAQPK